MDFAAASIVELLRAHGYEIIAIAVFLLPLGKRIARKHIVSSCPSSGVFHFYFKQPDLRPTSFQTCSQHRRELLADWEHSVIVRPYQPVPTKPFLYNQLSSPQS